MASRCCLPLVATTLLLAWGSASAAPGVKPVQWRDARGDATGPGTYVQALAPAGTTQPPIGSYDLQRVVWRDVGTQWELVLAFGAVLKPGAEPVVHLYLDTDGLAGSGVLQPLHGSGRLMLANGMGWEKAIVVAPVAAKRLAAELRAKAGAARAAVVLPTTQRNVGKSWVVRVDKVAMGSPKAAWSLGVAVLAYTDRPPADGLMSMPVRKSATTLQWGGGEDGACGSHVIDILVADSGAAKAKGPANPQFDLLGFACGGKSAVLPWYPFFTKGQ
jgi:hypothetical protein